MTSNLENMGCTHLSYSQGSMFIQDPARWWLSYVLGHREGSNAAMERGKAVEEGVEAWLKGEFVDVQDAIEVACSVFNRATALLCSNEAREKELTGIPGMVAWGIEAVRGLGTPIAYQEKIEVMLDDVPVPIIGYIDWTFDGLIIDLKTTKRMPSQISAAHRKQGALYRKAKGNYGVQFLYATPKKSSMLILENDQQDLDELHRAFRAMEKLCGLSDDRAEIEALLCPNYDSFYWSNQQTREKGREVFGI